MVINKRFLAPLAVLLVPLFAFTSETTYAATVKVTSYRVFDGSTKLNKNEPITTTSIRHRITVEKQGRSLDIIRKVCVTKKQASVITGGDNGGRVCRWVPPSGVRKFVLEFEEKLPYESYEFTYVVSVYGRNEKKLDVGNKRHTLTFDNPYLDIRNAGVATNGQPLYHVIGHVRPRKLKLGADMSLVSVPERRSVYFPDDLQGTTDRLFTPQYAYVLEYHDWTNRDLTNVHPLFKGQIFFGDKKTAKHRLYFKFPPEEDNWANNGAGLRSWLIPDEYKQ